MTPTYTQVIPDDIQDNKIYISKEYGVCIHNCPCGCKHQIVLPFTENQWTLTENNDKVSLTPSIFSKSLKCQSHYYIKNNNVQWC